jgi:hypothetical protein
MLYNDIYELLEAVRAYKLQGKERIRPCNSIKGTEVGYCTADSEGPLTSWVIAMPVLKAKAPEFVPKMRSFQDRLALLNEVRSGKFDSTRKVEAEKDPSPATSALAVDSEDGEVADFLAMLDMS